jgi:aspartate kinase
MRVLKFGGTSVGSSKNIQSVLNIVQSISGKKIVVLSAMSGTTNTLQEIADYLLKYNLEAAQEMFAKLMDKYLLVANELCESDEVLNNTIKSLFNEYKPILRSKLNVANEKRLMSLGEIVTTNMVAHYCHRNGIKMQLLSALDFMRIDVNGEPNNPEIAEKLMLNLEAYPNHDTFFTQGFICRNAKGDIDNLDRGGSDYSASIIGAMADAEDIQIWTDIDGMHNNDPRFVKNTFPVRELSYDEAAELAYFGAKILHPSSVLPARLKGIPVYLKNTMKPEAHGTLISNKTEPFTVKSIAAKNGITAINIRSGRMLMAYGFVRSVFEIFERYKTPVDLITTSEVAISVTIDDEKNLDNIVSDLRGLGVVKTIPQQSIISIVGDRIGESKGLAIKIFKALEPVSINMISFGGSQHNVSILVDENERVNCLNALNHTLFQ